MKLRDDFIVHNTQDDSMIVSTGASGFSGLVRGNRTFGAIVEILKNEVSEEDIVKALCDRFDADESKVSADVKKTLDTLRRIGALDE